ncbi:hypothetical protein Scep_008904 [Stephania cephalantha]|uniref:Uncharacterized protein n=1 Tax=Stephania cephalantha TaxID=152367 RepID=A0AAP0PC20_9MAGN
MGTESGQEAMNIDEDESSFVTERGFYQPSTEDTWDAYQALIGIVEQQLGGFSTAVLCGVAHEVLSVLKCRNIDTICGKRYEIERILNLLPDHTFDQLLEISARITDFFKPDDHLDDHRHDDGRDSMFVPEVGFYQPRTKETMTAYKLLLDVIKSQIGESQDAVILCTVAHEVLHILKSDEFGEIKNRKPFVENYLVNRITDNNFNILLYASDLIHDFADPRLGTVGSSSSSPVVECTSVGIGISESVNNAIRDVDFERSVQNGWSGWSDDEVSRLEENQKSTRGNDHDRLTSRLSQLTMDDIGNISNSCDGSDDDVSSGACDDSDEVDGGDESDQSGVDGGDSGSDGFVLVEEGEDWVMIDDSGTP